jgi:2,3,4,5-tetrahydropyridine-2-carboxylate N-succinyltransferase
MQAASADHRHRLGRRAPDIARQGAGRGGEAVAFVLAQLDARASCAWPRRSTAWVTHQWIKKAVLLSFRLEDNRVMRRRRHCAIYDKVPTKFAGYDEQFRAGGFRVVPPAPSRRGAFIAKNVVLMPSYVNIGAYVDEGTMVDTWATVGSCAQIGKNVHLSGGVGIGGVLEPLQANPTIIEDNCFIGARSEVVEGVIVEENCVISMGVFIGQSTRIYDRATGEITYGRVPAGSVVVSGSLPSADGKYSLYCAVIVKRVDAQTRAKVGINELLRVLITAACTRARIMADDPAIRGVTMIFDKLFHLMAEKKASDIFVSAGAPIHIKIQGTTMPINQQVMDPETIQRMAYEMLSPEQIRALREVEGDQPLLRPARPRQLPRQHVLAARHHRHRGALHPGRHPAARFAGPAQGARRSHHGKARPGAGGRLDRLGQVHHDGGDDRPSQQPTVGPHPDRRRPDRIPVQAQEVGGQPARDRAWTPRAGKTPEERHAPGARLHPDRRDPRPRNHAAALAYAQTGHLCLATLHANNSIPRAEPHHQLLRRWRTGRLLFLDLSVSLKASSRSAWCASPTASASGRRNPAQHAAHPGADRAGEVNGIKEAMEQSLAPGSQTFEQDLFRLYREGIITLDEALANSDSPTNLSWLINNSQFGTPSTEATKEIQRPHPASRLRDGPQRRLVSPSSPSTGRRMTPRTRWPGKAPHRPHS